MTGQPILPGHGPVCIGLLNDMYSHDDIAQARGAAALHLEVALWHAAPTRTQPGQTQIRAEILCIHRQHGGAPLRIGQTIDFWVDSRYRGQRSAPGDDQRLDIEDLQPGQTLVGYFDQAKDGRLDVVMQQIECKPG